MENRKKNSTQRTNMINFVLWEGLCDSRQQARSEARGALRKPAQGADTMCSALYPYRVAHGPSSRRGPRVFVES